jgi:hypothetical protein
MSICEFLSKLFNCKKKPKKVNFRLEIKDGVNKTDSVRRHLQEFTTINNKQAYELYEVTRLSSIIYRLRKQGMDIDTFKSKTTSKNGKGTVIITSYVY